MSFTELQQLKKIITESRHVLLLFAQPDDGDALCACLAWKMFLEKQHKQADVACSGLVLPKNLQFLSGADEIKKELTHLQKFIIKVDLSRAKIDTLSYDIKDNWLSIYLTPKQGTITKNELRTAQTTFKYDLIITVNASDLNALGEIFFNNTDLFYRLPVVNFDHRAGNEHFGHINLVDLNAAASCEIAFETLRALDESLLDKNIATAFLTGMIIKTKSFKTGSVTPRSLSLAGELVNLGADREKIIQQIYRTRSLAALKLWGQALSHLQTDRRLNLVWAAITREDFIRSGAHEEDLKDIIDELIGNAPEAKLVFLVYEHETGEGVSVIFHADKDRNAVELLRPFGATGDKRRARFDANEPLYQTAEKILNHLQQTIK